MNLIFFNFVILILGYSLHVNATKCHICTGCNYEGRSTTFSDCRFCLKTTSSAQGRYSIDKFCSTKCLSGTHETFGINIKFDCCKTDFCNSASMNEIIIGFMNLIGAK
ncbi:hypothetical protein BpHYR1_010910 [Brachionus plicatilis]|uniref:Snake toxin/toxin-like domain-containing protein n=1 Tax=Brachionus plicatilis TaxID=10195 RepID=A0A3M7Q7B1_BRAPC|nr:hypothetical protein BpHYR1_010910 [Brachionus plicatilis]